MFHRVDRITVNEIHLGNHPQLCTFAMTVYCDLKKHILCSRQRLSSEVSDFIFGQNSSFYETRR